MAANTRDIRRRIKSIRNTAQITKAMQMVAASKMRKAQAVALAGKPYASLLNKVLTSVRAGQEEGISHPLLDERPVKKELVIVVSTDKGLCGALNTNLFRELSSLDPSKTEFVACGRKAAQYLARTKRQLVADFPQKDSPGSLDTKVVSKFAIERFVKGEVDKVTVAYTDFVNTLTQVPRLRTLLPITSFEVEMAIGSAESVDASVEYLFEPDPNQVLEAVLPHYVHYVFYQLVLDARASEHSSRMLAMKNATDNAHQLIKDLSLEYNKIRQASITTEILEIATAQVALG